MSVTVPAQPPLANNTIHSLVSGGSLVAIKKLWKKEYKVGKDYFRDGGYQVVSSLVANNIKDMLTPLGLIPQGAAVDMWVRPLIVGAGYTLLMKMVSGDESYMYNLLLSAGSEIASSYLDKPVSGLLTGGVASVPVPVSASYPSLPVGVPAYPMVGYKNQVLG